MGLKEETVFKRHVELEPVSETREQFVQGKLFDLGDTVIIKESDEMGTIAHLGTNYVVVQISEDRSVRKWLEDVTKVDVKESNVPAKLSSAIAARGRHTK